MVATPASKDQASLADFLQILRLRKALIALILALVLLATAALGITLVWLGSSSGRAGI